MARDAGSSRSTRKSKCVLSLDEDDQGVIGKHHDRHGVMTEEEKGKSLLTNIKLGFSAGCPC